MEIYAPWQIYETLKKFIVYRKIETDYSFVDKERFNKEINHYEYISIRGRKIDKHGDRPVFIILIAPKSKYATKSQDFRKLMNTVNLEGNTEVIIISEVDLTNFIKKHIAELQSKNRELYLEDYTYSKFLIVIPEHISVPKHEIMEEVEVKQLLEKLYISKNHLPRILSTDPPIVWLGARPGDVIRIWRISETAGLSPYYRLVVRANTAI